MNMTGSMDPPAPGPGDVTVVRGSVRSPARTIAVGKTLRFDPNADVTMEMTGNLVVEGTLEMRPNQGVTHTLRFVGIDESRFVGGGMEVLGSDVGLWVNGRGRLDLQGEPRAGWNRSGKDPTWKPTDEVLTTPFAPGNHSTFASYSGHLATVSAPGGRVLTQEAFNLTRSVRIEGSPSGRTHVTIMSSAPQTVRYAAIRYVGPRHNGLPVLGRYGLHFHHCGDGSRGSSVEGTVVRDCGNHAFVPHGSHGVTMRDCVSYNTAETAFWWDEGARTDDTLWDHCLAALLPDNSSRANTNGFLLGVGAGNTCMDSVCAGNANSDPGAGFQWPSQANQQPENVWTFQDCIAHNNLGNGIRVWENDFHHHLIQGFVGFRNGLGVFHGAYRNRFAYTDSVCFENGSGLELWAVSQAASVDVIRFDGCRFDGVKIGHHAEPPMAPGVFADSNLGRVVLDEDLGPGWYDFIRCDLEPSDWKVERMNPASRYRVQRLDGTAYRVDQSGTTTPIPAFA
jgi:hypothetical protein